LATNNSKMDKNNSNNPKEEDDEQELVQTKNIKWNKKEFLQGHVKMLKDWNTLHPELARVIDESRYETEIPYEDEWLLEDQKNFDENQLEVHENHLLFFPQLPYDEDEWGGGGLLDQRNFDEDQQPNISIEVAEHHILQFDLTSFLSEDETAIPNPNIKRSSSVVPLNINRKRSRVNVDEVPEI